jgi:hypothetical protein
MCNRADQKDRTPLTLNALWARLGDDSVLDGNGQWQIAQRYGIVTDVASGAPQQCGLAETSFFT